MFLRVMDGGGAVAGVGLGEDAVDVALDRVAAEDELGGDLGVVVAAADEGRISASRWVSSSGSSRGSWPARHLADEGVPQPEHASPGQCGQSGIRSSLDRGDRRTNCVRLRSTHWFGSQLGHWKAGHDVSVDAITDTLILMAIAMVLTRTIAMSARAHALSDHPAAAVRI